MPRDRLVYLPPALLPTPGQALLFGTIAQTQRDCRGRCFKAVRTLARECGASVGAFYLRLRALEARGALRWSHVFEEKKLRPNHYELAAHVLESYARLTAALPMSIALRRDLRANCKVLLATLRDRKRRTQAQLASLLGCCRRTVCCRLRALADAGLLRVIRRGPWPAGYALMLPAGIARPPAYESDGGPLDEDEMLGRAADEGAKIMAEHARSRALARASPVIIR